jgi:excinuclease UvrABC helicase subunit UvrB
MKPARKEETTLELLVHEKLLDASIAAQISSRAKDLGESTVEAAISSGAVKEKDIARTLCKHLSLPYLDAARYFVKREVFDLMPMEFWEKNRAMPLDRIGNILTIAIADILPDNVKEEIEVSTNCKAAMYVTTHGALAQALHAIKEQLQVKPQG